MVGKIQKVSLLGYPRLNDTLTTRLEHFRNFLTLFAMFNELSPTTQCGDGQPPRPQPQPSDPVSAALPAT
jgi:hypothetical protein